MKFKLPFSIEKYLTNKFAMFYIFLQIDVHDNKGKLISSRKQMCHSLVENFLAIQYACYNENNIGFGFTAPHTTNATYFDTDNVERGINTASPISTVFSNKGLANIDTDGIVVGTGIVAPTPSTRNLTTKILHGIAAGQLSYQSQSSSAGVTISGQNTQVILTRTFVNNSGGVITVNEMGIISAGSFPKLILMDILAPAQTVNALQTLTISVTFKTTT